MNTHYCQGISQGYGNAALPLNEKHTEFTCDDIRDINNVSAIAEHIPAPLKRQLCPQVVCSLKCEGNCQQLQMSCSEEWEKQPITLERLQREFVKQPKCKNSSWLARNCFRPILMISMKHQPLSVWCDVMFEKTNSFHQSHDLVLPTAPITHAHTHTPFQIKHTSREANPDSKLWQTSPWVQQTVWL